MAVDFRGMGSLDTKEILKVFKRVSLTGMGFLGGASGKEPAGQCRKYKKRWVGKIPWRRAWQPDPVFLPGESMDRSWQAMVHSVTQSRTQLKQLSMHACTGKRRSVTKKRQRSFKGKEASRCLGFYNNEATEII